MLRETCEQHIRDVAVALVDLQLGYTMEFSSNPEGHRAEYDEMERHLAICMQTNNVKLVEYDPALGSLIVSGTDEEISNAALRMALHAVRNTYLEDLHANGKITQAQMKKLMIEVVNRIYGMLKVPQCLVAWSLPEKWAAPKIPYSWTTGGHTRRANNVEKIMAKRQQERGS